MQRLLFYLFVPIIYFISIQPFFLLYLLSDFLYLIVYRIVGYRKKVVFENLRNAFPKKTEAERLQIAKDYYRHMCDLLVEACKLLTISQNALTKRCKIDASSDVYTLVNQSRSTFCVLGHYGNWEWAGPAASIQTDFQMLIIYRPLSNKFADQLISKARSRFGGKVVSMNDTFRKLTQYKNDLICTAFVADQTPTPEKALWIDFLNQDTPMFTGMEKLAKRFNPAILYISIQKVKRGVYKMHNEILHNDPASLSEGELTRLYARRLEDDIRVQPHTWLWSHRRWKHKRVL